MNINELAKEVHENAVNHGWWEKPPSLPEALCLIHAELSEALEEYRNGSPLVYGTCALSPDDCDFALTCENVGHPDAGGEKAGACKPELSWQNTATTSDANTATEGNGYDKLFQSRREIACTARKP